MNEFGELADSAPVLLVDDTSANLLALEAVLSPLQVPIVSARSGAEALAHIDQRGFAVALIDVQMPEMDGFELTRRLRETTHGQALPVLLVTAIHRDELFARKGYASGAADYITKPYDPQIIRARVKAFIDLFHQRELVRRAQIAVRTQERDEAIRRLVALERIATAALETSDLKALLAELLATFIAAADAADSAALLLRETEYLRFAAGVGVGQEANLNERTRIGEGFAGLIASERRPLELDRDGIAKTLKGPLLAAHGLRALYGVPLLHDGQLLGVAQIGTTRADGFTNSERRLFLAAAERASLAVARTLEASRLNDVLTSAPAYIGIVNASGDYVFANPPLRRLFDAELVGSNARERGFGEAALAAIQGALASGETLELAELAIPPEMMSKSLAGVAYVRFTAQPLRNLSGAVDRVLVFASDITAQVEARREIEEAQHVRARLLDRERALRRAAELASTAKDEFLATVSHELRTPLNAILGWASIARSRPPEDVDRALSVIERNARTQARIVEDVLDFSRMTKGKMRLTFENVNLRDIVDAALESVRPAAEAKGVYIDVKLLLEEPACGDPERLQQVVWNLVSNAVKYSGAQGRIDIFAAARENFVELVVSDNGQGIEPDFLPHVFEPFQQANGTTTRRHGGLGLGLAIVKQIVQGHGGTIEAHSEGLGHGAKFVVRLPTALGSSTTDERDLAHSESDREPPSDDVRLDGVRVLLVDDDDDSRELMAEALSAHGADVAALASAERGVSEVRRVRPHVLVSDIAMPEIDGYELMRRVRLLPDEDGGRTPAVAVTAHAGKDVIARAFSAGFQRYAAKPIDLGVFLSTVAELAASANKV